MRYSVLCQINVIISDTRSVQNHVGSTAKTNSMQPKWHGQSGAQNQRETRNRETSKKKWATSKRTVTRGLKWKLIVLCLAVSGDHQNDDSIVVEVFGRKDLMNVETHKKSIRIALDLPKSITLSRAFGIDARSVQRVRAVERQHRIWSLTHQERARSRNRFAP